MTADEKDLQPEREQTDEGLRAEREKTDVELAAGLLIIEESAAAAVPADGAEESDAVAKARLEREESLRELLRLLPLEREKTDQYLLTERARSDEAVSNRDDFLSIVSHDLRNLVGVVSMGAQALEREGGADPSRSGTLQTAQRIRRAATRMTRLISDLVDVSALEAGKLGIVHSLVNATALVTEAVEVFRPSASAKEIALNAEPATEPVVGTFDHDRVLQVLANLIGNAIKFTPSGGTIGVGCARDAAGVRFSVRDTGPGIPEAQLEAVFERFWQVGAGDRRGLGLGLYIAKGIVDAHGGSIWVESVLGHGSVFHFTLAAREDVGEAAAHST